MKKFLSWLLVVAMVIGMAPAAFATESDGATVIYSQTDLALTVSYNSYGEAIANSHEYTWTATENGTVTVNITSVDPGVRYWFGDAMPVNATAAKSNDFTVTAGTEYLFKISGYADWADCAATVSFNITFTAAEGTTETVKETYVFDETVTLTTGDNSVTLDENAYTTVYEFSPEEAATYTFSVPEGYQVGCWGYTSANIYDVTGDAKTTTLEHTITAVGQSVMVGITGEGSTTLTITKGDAYVEKTVNELTYENKATLTQFAIPEGYVAGDYVDVTASHTAVLGEDGYYHLDSADGDILLVDMDYIYELTSVMESERPVMTVNVPVDENTTNKYDIVAAVQAYEAVCDENGYYPLTEDLIFFYKDYAINTLAIQYFYLEEYVDDTAWMFACLTMAEESTLSVGTAYKFGMAQGNLDNQVYYLTGEMDGYYMATTAYASTAADVYVEETEGGYYFYAMVDGAKQYINMVVSGTYVNGAFEETASTVYTYDSENNTLVATVNDTLYWFGTRNDKSYTTMGPVKVEYEGFYGQFYEADAIEEPETPADPEADSTLTIAEAIALGESKAQNSYTEGKYYVTGVITEVYNETYGNMKITDADGNILTVYGTYDADGTNRYDAMEVKPVAGDTVTVYGVIGNYYGAQMKSGWITAHTPAEDDALEGSGTEEDPYIIESLPYTIEVSYANEEQADAGVFYAYTPEVNGTISITGFDEDFNMGILTDMDSLVHITDSNALEVTAGTQVLLCHWAMWAGDYDLTLEFTESTGDDNTGDTGDGDDGDDDTGDTGDNDTETTPDSGEWSGTDVAVAADEVITIVYTPETNGTLSVEVSCETGWQVNVNSEFTSESFWSDGSDTPDAIKLTAGTTYTIEIVPYDQADGWNTCDAVMTYELTWTAESTGTEVEGSGTDEDPYSLIIGENNASVVGDPDNMLCEGVYFQWTATGDGTLTLTFDENDPTPYVCIYVNSVQNMVFESSGDNWTATAELTEGDYVYIKVETWDFVSANYTFQASFDDGSSDSGSDAEDTVLEIGDNYIELPIDDTDGTSYTFTATETGTLYLMVTEFFCDYGDGEYVDNSDYMSELAMNTILLVADTSLTGGYFGSIDVVAGETYTITWNHGAWDWYGWAATLNLSYSDELLPVMGGADMPYELYAYDCPTTSAEIPAGADVYYSLYSFAGMTFTVTGENAYVLVASYDYETYEEVWNRYDAVDGVVEVPISSMGYGATTVRIGNAGTEAATFTLNGYYPEGSQYAPKEISGEGTFSATVAANSEGYYFNWTAEAEGLLTVTVNGESWQYSINNITKYVYGDYHASNDDPVVSSETVPAWEGNVFEIVVNTAYDEMNGFPAGTVEITISFEPCEIIPGSVYDPYVVSRYDAPADVTVGAGEEVYVKLSSFSGTFVSFTGEGGYVVVDGVKHEAVDGVVTLTVEDYSLIILLGNSSDAEVTYTVSYSYPLGTSNNPEIITEDGTYTTPEFEVGTYDLYYYQYTAEADGTITVEVLNDTNWKIDVWNKTNYDSVNGKYNTAESSTLTLKVSKGDVVSIYGSTYDYETYQTIDGALSFKFSFERDTTPGLPLYDGDNAIILDNLDGSMTGSKYTYVATQSGTLYLTLSEVYYVSYSSYTDSVSEPREGRDYLTGSTKFLVNDEPLANGYYGAIEVEAGDEVTISWNMKYNSTWKFNANLNLSYEGYNPAPGSEADPIEVSFYDCYDIPVETVEIAAGSTAHYILTGFDGYILTITGEGAYLVYNGETYTDEDGDGKIVLVGDSHEMAVEIGNSGDSAATFSIGGEFPVGDQNNPQQITDGEYEVTVEAHDYNYEYYLAYTVECNGVLEITVSGDNWQYMILNQFGQVYYDGEWVYAYGWGPDYHTYSTAFEDKTNTVQVDVWAGDVIMIAVNTIYVADDFDGLYGSSPAGTINVSVAAEYDHEDEDGDDRCDICNAYIGDGLLGDVNGDGTVNTIDAMLVLQYAVGMLTADDLDLTVADVNGDSAVNTIDAMLILQYAVGIITELTAVKN